MKVSWIKWVISALRKYLELVDVTQSKKKQKAREAILKDTERTIATVDNIEETKRKMMEALEKKQRSLELKSEEYSKRMSSVISEAAVESSKALDLKDKLDILM